MTVNIYAAKTRLSDLVARVETGERSKFGFDGPGGTLTAEEGHRIVS